MEQFTYTHKKIIPTVWASVKLKNKHATVTAIEQNTKETKNGWTMYMYVEMAILIFNNAQS